MGDKKTWLLAVQLLKLTQVLGSYRSEKEKSNYALIKLCNLRPHKFDQICQSLVLDALYLLHVISSICFLKIIIYFLDLNL